MSLHWWSRFGAGSSSSTAPTAPTLAIADNGDGTGGVATISGGDSGSTHTVYSQLVDGELGTAASWTARGSRTGNGTITLSPAPTADKYYWWHAKATSSGGTAVSNLVYQNITSGALAVHYQCLVATQARIQGLSLSGIANGSILVQKVPVAPSDLWGASPKTYQFPGILITPLGSERMAADEGTNVRDDVGYPVVVSILDADNRHATANHARNLLWRQKIARAFRNQRLPGVSEIIRAVIEPGPVIDIAKWGENYFHSALTIRFTSREVRGI